MLAIGWMASASGVYVTGVSMTNTTGWTKLWSQQNGSSNPWVVGEIWIGYANGAPSGNITVNFSSNVTAPIVDCQKFTGISSSSPLENAYSALGSGTGLSVSNVVVANASDLEFAFTLGYNTYGSNPTVGP